MAGMSTRIYWYISTTACFVTPIVVDVPPRDLSTFEAWTISSGATILGSVLAYPGACAFLKANSRGTDRWKRPDNRTNPHDWRNPLGAVYHTAYALLSVGLGQGIAMTFTTSPHRLPGVIIAIGCLVQSALLFTLVRRVSNSLGP